MTTCTAWSDDVLEEISCLGDGGAAAVHKAKSKHTGKIVVRKTINTREGQMKQLLREFSIISSIEHINIILFHGAYMSSSHEVKIILEFCEGGSLQSVGTRIKELNAVVEEGIAGRLAEGVLQGLAYLNTKKIIHRDVKPSNILLSCKGIVKLDIPISCELENSFEAAIYMAPERIVGQIYTSRADVWSTGICLLELVQNRCPFPSDLPPIELLMHITTSDPPQLEDEPGRQWSDDMKDFIKQMLTFDALTRPTPKDMLAHPWVVDTMKQKCQMAQWIRKVWDWPRDNSSSSCADAPPSSDVHTESPQVSFDLPPQA
ncbi:MAP kinase kinase MKK2/SSP33 [Mycena venus]|uniref:mitogen-activated protein kinase kinase n=1 Tax=Mycena venus TaxID=2733690 RepID=A0A8H7CZX3_9AGAR|nr:MAP kinase kinase MKK2/SSP33 [Mycena venus]